MQKNISICNSHNIRPLVTAAIHGLCGDRPDDMSCFLQYPFNLKVDLKFSRPIVVDIFVTKSTIRSSERTCAIDTTPLETSSYTWSIFKFMCLVRAVDFAQADNAIYIASPDDRARTVRRSFLHNTGVALTTITKPVLHHRVSISPLQSASMRALKLQCRSCPVKGNGRSYPIIDAIYLSKLLAIWIWRIQRSWSSRDSVETENVFSVLGNISR